MISTLKKLFGSASEQSVAVPMSKSYNLELLKKSIAYNPESLREIICLFMQQKPLELQYLEEAIQTRNLPILARRAHSLKGNLNLFGMNQTYDRLAWIEKYAKEETSWHHTIDVYWHEIKFSFETVLREIQVELEPVAA